MKLNNRIKEQARKLKASGKYKKLFVNERGEFFEQENPAMNSVNGDKSKYADITNADLSDSPEGSGAPAKTTKKTPVKKNEPEAGKDEKGVTNA